MIRFVPLPTLTQEQADRFCSHVHFKPGCWEWLASTRTGGYGQVTIGQKKYAAHRVAYELFAGPIPEGKVLDHLCRNIRCVRPTHLEPVEQAENLLRGETINRRNAAKTSCSQGHAYTSSTTHRRPDGARRCAICNRERNRAWKARQKEQI